MISNISVKHFEQQLWFSQKLTIRNFYYVPIMSFIFLITSKVNEYNNVWKIFIYE
jgi:hypothetical protein